MADPGVPIFRGGSGSDCEEFVRAVSAYAFENDRAKDDEWIATYAGTRLSGKALRWYVRQDKAVKLDWSALQVALLDQYPPSDDEDDEEEADKSKAQPLPKNIPTPAAAAGPSAGVITMAASAPIPPSANKGSIAGCNKARIRVEDKDGTSKGWISIHLEPYTAHLPTALPDEALHVKADKVNSGPTTLRILNVDGWSQLGIRWSNSPFNDKDGSQSGQPRPCYKEGGLISTGILDLFSGGECLPGVWDIGDAGVITPTWRNPGGPGSSGIPLSVLITPQNRLRFCSTRLPQSAQPQEHHVSLFYEPIE